MWEEIEAGPSWDRFEDSFSFRAGTDQSDWPAINEPVGSVTFDLTPCFDGDPTAEWLRQSVNFASVWALTNLVPADQSLTVLDWQHPSYRFWPQRCSTTRVEEMFGPITPVPDGNYYAFLTQDYTSGTFGHPWEATLCVFGPDLVALLDPLLRAMLAVVRSSRT